jgi:hypothetical protein
MTWPLQFLIPYDVWRCEGSYARWLELREVTGFFWEIGKFGDWVVVEVIE